DRARTFRGIPSRQCKRLLQGCGGKSPQCHGGPKQVSRSTQGSSRALWIRNRYEFLRIDITEYDVKGVGTDVWYLLSAVNGGCYFSYGYDGRDLSSCSRVR